METKGINEKLILLFIFLAALFLRISAVINLPAQYKVLKMDAHHYDGLAVNLLAGKGYFIIEDGNLSRTWKPPVYPLFLALVYSIFGYNHLAVRIIQCIMGALLCVIIYFIAKKTFNKKVALLSAIIIAFYQPNITNRLWGPGMLFAEEFFSFLFSLLILFIINRLFVHFSLRNGIITGILMGLLSLTRPIVALFPIFLFTLLIYKNKYSLLSGIKKIFPIIIAFILLILPWTVRNYFVHKAFVPFSTEGGILFCACNNLYADGSWVLCKDECFTEQEKKQMSKMSEPEYDNLFRRHGVDFLLKNYKKLPKLFAKKLLVMWDVYKTAYDSDDRRTYNIWYSIVLMFSLLGIVKTINSKPDINSSLLILIFIYLSVIALIFCGDQRYRYFVEPYLIIFASFGILTIYSALKNKLLSILIISLVIGVNLLFYRYSDLLLKVARAKMVNYLRMEKK